MSTDITPADSVCPIYLVPVDAVQLAKDRADDEALAEAKAARVASREALLTKLGITADEAQLLLGS
jgi:hypothetical protein